MAIEQELNGLTNELRALINALERGGSTTIDRETREFYKRTRDYYDETEDHQDRADKYAADRMTGWKDLLKVNQRSTVMLSRLAQNSATQLKQHLESLQTLDEIRDLPDKFAKQFGSFKDRGYQDVGVFKELVGQVRTMADVFRVQEKLANIGEFAEGLRKVKLELLSAEEQLKAGLITQEEFDKSSEALNDDLAELAKAAKLSEKDLANFGVKLGEMTSEMMNATEEMVNAQTRNAQKYTDSIVNEGKTLKGFWTKGLAAAGAAGALAGNLDDIAKTAAKFGGTIQWTMDSLKTGMSQKELIELQAERRQSVMALGEGFEGHTKMLLRDQAALYTHIGSLDAVTRANASFLDLAQTVGGTHDKTSVLGLMDIQSNAFKSFNNTLGMTIEQFTSYNDEMLLNAEAQSVFFKTDTATRGKYMTDLYGQFDKLTITMGLTVDQAKRAQSAFQSIAGMTAKERLGKGAKMAAAASAMGRGDLSGYILDAVRKGETNTERFAETTKELMAAQKSIIGRFGGMGGAGEFFADALRETTDTNDLLGDKGPMVAAINQLGKGSTMSKATVAIKEGLPRTGQEWMEPYWKEASMTWGAMSGALSNIDGATKGILAATTTWMAMQGWGALKGVGSKITKGGTMLEDAAAAGALGKYGKLGAGAGRFLGGLGRALPWITVGAAGIGGLSGAYSGMAKTGELGQGLKGFGNGIGAMVGADSLFGQTRVDMLENIDKKLNPVITDINDHLADIKMPSSMKLEAMSADSISKMSDKQYEEQSKRLQELKLAIERSGEESKQTRFILEEINAVQKQMSEVDRSALKAQTETAKSSKTIADQTKDRDKYLNDRKSAYERGDLMRQMNQNMGHVNFRR